MLRPAHHAAHHSFHHPAAHHSTHAAAHHPTHHAAAERDFVALRRRQVRLRHGVRGKAHRRIEWMLAQRRRVLVGEVEQPVFEAAIEWIDDAKALPGRPVMSITRSARMAGRGSRGRQRLVGRDGLTVERDHRRPVVLELEREDARVGGVDQPQPQPLARPHREGLGDAAIDRDGVADPAVVARIHEVAEVVADLGVRQQTPVVEDPGDVAIDLDRPRSSTISGP